jgi:hypothetical protein
LRFAELADEVSVTVGVVFPTVTVVAGEVAGLLFASPDVLAVIGFAPSGSEGTVIVATPFAIVPVPSTVPPLENVTVPVTPVGTVSVIVTGVLGGGVVDDTAGGGNTGVVFPTVTVVAGEVAGLVVASPGVLAVIGSLPIGSEGTVIVATPLTIVPVPSTVPPLENVTVPVTPVGTVSVIVTGVLGGGVVDDTAGGGNTGVSFVTVTVVAGEVAGLLFASPGVLAVIGSLPIGSVVTVIVATPPTIGAVPITVPPSVNVTGPGTPGGTVSVIVSDPPYGIVGDETTGPDSTGVPLLTVCVRGADVAVVYDESPP